MEIDICMPHTEATDRQLLLAILRNQGNIATLLNQLQEQHYEMRMIMSTVDEDLAEQTRAIDTLGLAFTEMNRGLQAALAERTAIQERLDAALANDATDAATIEDLRAQLAANGNVLAAVGAKIQENTRRLNQIGTPTGPAPDEPPVEPVPPVPPVVDDGSGNNAQPPVEQPATGQPPVNEFGQQVGPDGQPVVNDPNAAPEGPPQS